MQRSIYKGMISIAKIEIGLEVVLLFMLEMLKMSQLVPISIEAVCVEVIKPKMKPFLITSIYRPPNSKVDFMDNLENYFNELDKQNSELIISGDLNWDLSISDLIATSVT